MRSFLALSCSLVLVLSACGTRETTNSNQARVRNQAPANCGDADFQACPEIAFERCADGQEPVIDYSSDCCPHFTCQPLCVPEGPCPLGPAPVCPPGSKLVITTATDCCPAYRCEPSVDCDNTDPVPCPLAMPWCGEGVEPIIVGNTDGCCPIFQCPCDVPVANGGTLEDGAPRSDPTLCGCTFPACAPGEQLECLGENICGYPCVCTPAPANCQSDFDCGPDMKCDLSYCLGNPGCLPDEPCTADCWGICVGFVQNGCSADNECPMGQRCEMQCMGWGCVPGSPDDSGGERCGCFDGDWTCTCQPDGSCSGQQCEGWCVPATVCDPATCAAPRCPDAIEVGIDECGCPIFECGACQPSDIPCAIPDCVDPVPVGIDANCCPIFCCPDGSGGCPTPEPRPL